MSENVPTCESLTEHVLRCRLCAYDAGKLGNVLSSAASAYFRETREELLLGACRTQGFSDKICGLDARTDVVIACRCFELATVKHPAETVQYVSQDSCVDRRGSSDLPDGAYTAPADKDVVVRGIVKDGIRLCLETIVVGASSEGDSRG